jgi:hypothetical protein
MDVLETTASQAKTLNGSVVIEVHVLRGRGDVEIVTVDVDGYAEALARDLMAAIVDRNLQRSEGD